MVYGTLPDILASSEDFYHRGSLLFEQNGTETGVESTNTLVLKHFAEASNESIGICWFGDETDTGGFERAEGDISEEFCKSRRGQVDSCTVVGGSLVSKEVDGLLLEQFVSSELESTLEEISCRCWAESGQKRACTLICDDLSDSAKKTSVVCDRIELDSGLDAAGYCQSIGLTV